MAFPLLLPAVTMTTRFYSRLGCYLAVRGHQNQHFGVGISPYLSLVDVDGLLLFVDNVKSETVAGSQVNSETVRDFIHTT